MPLYYVDSSALVKAYVPEVGSEWVSALLTTDPAATSAVAVAEVASALARRTLEGKLTAEARDIAYRQFLADTRQHALVSSTQGVIREAATLLLQTPSLPRLRTLDAIHIASARSAFARARRRGIATGAFVTADHTLAEAASRAGLVVANPEDYP